MAYQTSCASYTSGRVGLSSATAVVADAAGREQTQHGSPLFPIACYAEDLSCYSVAWHWHEEFEFILAALGPIHVDVNKTRLTLQTGQGVFINSGALHAVEPAEGRALLHSGVFQPGLVGGMDTVFWQKLIRPLLQPGTPPFFLLDEAVPWQRQVLLCLREAWKGVADEPFDYENRVRYHLTAALRLLITQCVSGKVKVSEQEQIASERMKQMLRYVEEHYAEELTVEKLAGCVALSESACLRSFRQFLGITPIQYVKQFRVEKSRRAAALHPLKTGEVGLECGFRTQATLSRPSGRSSTAPPGVPHPSPVGGGGAPPGPGLPLFFCGGLCYNTPWICTSAGEKLMSKATIVIPNINGKGWLKDSIESIYAQTEQDFDLIVVDNGSTDESLEQARSYCTRPNFTLIENGRNTGFSYAVNQGIARAQSKYVVLFNNDAFAEPQWLAELFARRRCRPQNFCGAKFDDPSL